ncbi:DUF2829 domain-containing protein [Arenibacter sp. 6A1]|uniref:Thoeris anti-defense Tad2 family protein n=1 Tax=Arenibacter sp. 6A1 TaxID=2720391 RepID=UPI0014487C13|nr:MW1434 family type I TA system toxin [Arenibacter sp. 6A1]NKI28254.1 DUF2829 domain-containing protein [Arenibacter sp. 6A1]
MKLKILFLFALVLGFNMSAVAVTGSDHKEKTKTEFSADLDFSAELIIDNSLNKVKMKTVSYAKANEALKQGERVCRQDWIGKGLFVFMQVPSQIPMDIVPKMTSLPQSVKDEFLKRKKNNTINCSYQSIKYRDQFAMVYPDNVICGWSPSPSDVLSDDWIVLNS